MKLTAQENTAQLRPLHGATGWYARNGVVQVLQNPHPLSIEDGEGGVWASNYLVWVGEQLIGEAKTLAEAADLAAAVL